MCKNIHIYISYSFNYYINNKKGENMENQKKLISLSLDSEIIKKIEKIGKEKGMTKQNLIRYWISEALEERDNYGN